MRTRALLSESETSECDEEWMLRSSAVAEWMSLCYVLSSLLACFLFVFVFCEWRLVSLIDYLVSRIFRNVRIHLGIELVLLLLYYWLISYLFDCPPYRFVYVEDIFVFNWDCLVEVSSGYCSDRLDVLIWSEKDCSIIFIK